MLYAFFWVIPAIWSLYADVSEHSVCSIYLPMKMEQTELSETSEYKIQTPDNYPKESTQAYNSQLANLRAKHTLSCLRSWMF